MLPVFKRSEDYEHGADEFHGAGGELRVEERRVSWEILDAWRDAAEECGIPKIAEFNRGDNFGNAYFQMNQRRGVRWSATKAFLRPVLKRPNLTVRTGALVERVLIETRDGVKRATGVVVRSPAAARRRCARGARCCSRPARSARRRFCSCRASVPPSCCGEHGVAVVADSARRRREPARSPADSLDLQSAQHAHVESPRADVGSAEPRWRSSTRCSARAR